MIRSLLGVIDLARDASLAVGAYVGVLREHVKAEWATVLGGSFDEPVEEAKARMEAQADMLADKEAEEEVSEPTCFNPQPGKHKFSHCDCDTAVDNEVRPAAQRVEVLGVCPTEWWPEDASGGHKCCLTGGHSGDHICGAGCGVRLSPPLSSPVAEAAVGEPRSGLSTTPAPAPGTSFGSSAQDTEEVGAPQPPVVGAPTIPTQQDWLMACAELDVLIGSDVWRPAAAQALRELADSIDIEAQR